MIRKLLLAGALSLFTAAAALAQAQLPAGQVIGNSTASARPARGETLTAIIDRALGSTQNQMLVRGASTWGVITPAASSILVSDGSNAPSWSTTLPAHTLGGTISGGGNQINNVIIGNSTPLAGSFTSLAYSTTLTGTSTNSSCAAFGRLGATTPAFRVDCSAGTQVAGLLISGAATGGTVVIQAIDSGSNTPIQLTPKGTGVVNIGGATSTSINLTNSGGTTLVNVGTAGTSGGQLAIAGSTSGALTLVATGAVGSNTLTLPIATDTLVGKATTDTLTNKTLTSSTDVLGGVTMTLGSDANGDTYYRSASVLTRLGIGATNTVNVSTGSIPSWVATSTSAQIEAGTANKILTADIIYDPSVAITFNASQTWDFSTFLNGTETLTANITSLTCSNMKASQSGVIQLTQDATGSRTMVAAWCSQFRWATGARGVLSTAANAVDTLFYQCISTSICYVSLSKAQAN